MPTEILNELVAAATGEPLTVIDRIGFSPADQAEVDFDPEPPPGYPAFLDWDEVDATRYARLMPC